MAQLVYPARPRHTQPGHAIPSQATPYPSQATPYPARPRHTQPGHAIPSQATPYPIPLSTYRVPLSTYKPTKSQRKANEQPSLGCPRADLFGRLLGPKTLIFLRESEVFYATATRRQRTGNAPATRRQPAGKDNLAPAEDLHNKNPSLVALGKNKS